MQLSTILSLLAVASIAVANPAVVRRQTGDVVGVQVDHNKVPVKVDVPVKDNNVVVPVKDNNIANGVLEDGVNVDHTLTGPVNAAVAGQADQFAPKGGLPHF